MRSIVQNPDTYFQSREAVNPYYDALPGIVEYYMGEMSKLTGRDYKLFNYYGAPDAEYVVRHWQRLRLPEGSRGLSQRPGAQDRTHPGAPLPSLQRQHLLAALPRLPVLTALDRTKEAGANGDPLYEDIAGA